MKMTLAQAMEAVERGETPEQYEKRIRKMRRLSIERDFLEDAIFMLEGDRKKKKQDRLDAVNQMLEELS